MMQFIPKPLQNSLNIQFNFSPLTALKTDTLKYFGYAIICALAFVGLSHASPSQRPSQIEDQADKNIQQLYKKINNKKVADMSARIHWFSEQFLGKPYVLGALGEGENASFDQYPRYRTDGFDCLTYVTTVVSLAQAHALPQFKNCLKHVRYSNSIRSYINRNHFTSLDWNLNNSKKGFVQDITENIVDKNNQPVALYSTTLIDKPQWYQKKTIDSVRLIKKNPTLREQRLKALKKQGQKLPATPVKIAYIPLNILINPQGQLNRQLIQQIPDGAIIEIVRPDWNIKNKIGTNLHVSHLGFLIKKKQSYYYREASSLYNKVVDVPLKDYLIRAQKSPTIKGINIQQILSNNNYCDRK